MRLLESVNLRVEESGADWRGRADGEERGTRRRRFRSGRSHQHGLLGHPGRSRPRVGVVTAIGGEAEIGRIQTMLADVEQFETPLTREMNQFGKQLS